VISSGNNHPKHKTFGCHKAPWVSLALYIRKESPWSAGCSATRVVWTNCCGRCTGPNKRNNRILNMKITSASFPPFTKFRNTERQQQVTDSSRNLLQKVKRFRSLGVTLCRLAHRYRQSEKLTASTVSVCTVRFSLKREIASSCQISTNITMRHGVICQKNWIFINTCVRKWHLAIT
jgi:hypothetical protein